MTKAVKLTMYAAGIVVLLVVAAFAVFALTFDVNDYKGQIADAVRDETGRTLIFKGDMRMTYFPSLGVQVDGLELSNAPGFGKEPMARVGNARISVRLTPLFSGQVMFRRIYLDGLVLNLSRNADGVTNWDDLTGGPRAAAVSGDGFAGEPVYLEAAGISVENASLNWRDARSGRSVTLGGIDLDLGDIRGTEPFEAEGKMEFQLDDPDLRGSLEASCSLSLDIREHKLSATEISGSVKAEGKDVPGGTGEAKLTADGAEYGWKRDTLAARGMSLAAYGVTLHFDGTLEGVSDLKQLAGTLAVDQFDGRKLLTDLGLTVPPTADDKALTGVAVNSKVAYTPRSLALKDLDLSLDGSSVKGDFKAARSEVGLSWYSRLTADTLDLDRYLPARKDGGDAEKTAKTGDADPILLDSKTIRRLTLDTEFKAAKFRYRGVWLENLRAVVKSRHGLLRFSPVTAELYGGSLSLDSTVNALTDHPKSDILVSLNKVDIGALSQDALGEAEYGGLLQFKGALSCEGNRRTTMLRSLNGKVSFNLSDGIFPGVDLKRMAKTTQETKGKKTGTVEAAETDSTQFGSIDGTGIITAGVLNNRDLEVKAPGLRAKGEGAVSLSTRRIDYLLKVKLVTSSKGQGGKSSDDSFGVMVPIRVSGTLDDPRYWVSLTEYVKALGGAVIGVAGTVLGGVKSVVTTVGDVVTGADSSSTKDGDQTEKKDFSTCSDFSDEHTLSLHRQLVPQPDG